MNDELKEMKSELNELFGKQESNIEVASRALKVMAHPARLKILCILRDGEKNVQSLEFLTDLAQANLSQHLSLLKDRGLVKSRRDGNFSFYRIADDRVLGLFEQVKEIYCE